MFCKEKQKEEKLKKELDHQKAEFFERWKICWKDIGEKGENLEIFSELFGSTYEYVKYKKNKNKKSNSRWKNIFMLLLVAEMVALVIFIIFILRNGEGIWTKFAGCGLFLIIFILAGGIVAKWIDIKKYQETWARHSRHLHKMESEMLKFVSGLEPYGKSNQKKIFVQNIIKIWDTNQDKFTGNMENKEKELMDIYENLKRLI